MMMMISFPSVSASSHVTVHSCCISDAGLCIIALSALSGIATDVEMSINEIQTLLDEEDKQETEFQV